MTEELILENWADLKSLRESKGISIVSLSEKMRLPVERIEFLEAGVFDSNDLIITKLQLKNYAKYLDIEYENIIELAGLKQENDSLPVQAIGESLKIKKTRTYQGRKKKPNKLLVYIAIVVGTLALIFALNRLAVVLNLSSDVFEITQHQVNALNTPTETPEDTNSFRPFLPQAHKEVETIDILDTMSKLYSQSISFPVIVKIFPKNDISYRQEINGSKTTENYILNNTPTLLKLTKPGRSIFYNTRSTRFVIDGYELRDEAVSQILIDINEDRKLIIYTK